MMKGGGALDQLLTGVAFQVCTEMVEAASVGCPGREHAEGNEDETGSIFLSS